MPGVIRAALAIVPAILSAMVAFFLSFAVSGSLWINLGASLFAFSLTLWSLLRRFRRRVAISVAGTMGLLALVSLPSLMDRLAVKPQPEPDELIQRIGRAAIPLASLDAGTGFTDLAPLERVWEGVRVVTLGEATHGTSEFFRMKHRLTEFLVTRMGFRHFAMELDDHNASAIEAYIQGGGGNNPVATLGWPWGTREMAAMVDWMRRYNSTVAEPGRVHFHGFDYQGERRDFRMAQNVLGLLDQLRADRVVLWAHNAHVSSGPGWMGSYLKPVLRNQIYLTGFEFHDGRFTSNFNWVRTYQAEPADRRYYADALRRIGRPILFLDFRAMQEDPEVGGWLSQPRFTHELQEMHGLLRLNPGWVRTNESWPSLFDGVLYIERSTPAGLL